MFELERGISNLKGTCYFEFVKNSDKKKPCWNEAAYYLKDDFFSFFYPAFKCASNRFDWYEFNKFNQSEIKKLIKELSLLERGIEEIKKKEQFKDFFKEIPFWTEIDGELENWKEYIGIFNINTIKLRELAAECSEEKQVLWVLGI